LVTSSQIKPGALGSVPGGTGHSPSDRDRRADRSACQLERDVGADAQDAVAQAVAQVFIDLELAGDHRAHAAAAFFDRSAQVRVVLVVELQQRRDDLAPFGIGHFERLELGIAGRQQDRRPEVDQLDGVIGRVGQATVDQSAELEADGIGEALREPAGSVAAARGFTAQCEQARAQANDRKPSRHAAPHWP
jgi:hypothetical protein